MKLAAAMSLPGAKPGDHFHYVVTLNGDLHVLGGMRFAEGEIGPMNQHWRWDGKTWHERAALPKPSRSKAAAYGVLNVKLYVFSKVDAMHHVYDPNADRWSETPAPIPTVLVMPAVVADIDQLHVLGGIDPSHRLPSGNVRSCAVKANRWQSAE